jgi:uncharacterized membrane protein YadS
VFIGPSPQAITAMGADGPRPPLPRRFAVAFAFTALVALNSIGSLPKAVSAIGADSSSSFLVAGSAGIGMNTQLRELVTARRHFWPPWRSDCCAGRTDSTPS